MTYNPSCYDCDSRSLTVDIDGLWLCGRCLAAYKRDRDQTVTK